MVCSKNRKMASKQETPLKGYIKDSDIQNKRANNLICVVLHVSAD